MDNKVESLIREVIDRLEAALSQLHQEDGLAGNKAPEKDVKLVSLLNTAPEGVFNDDFEADLLASITVRIGNGWALTPKQRERAQAMLNQWEEKKRKNLC